MARNPLTAFRSGSLLGGDPFRSLHRDMNRLFDDVLRGTGLPTRRSDELWAGLLERGSPKFWPATANVSMSTTGGRRVRRSELIRAFSANPESAGGFSISDWIPR